MEAYNRRATANYGLRRAQACYSDLEQVLSRNPLHFGALCGKVCGIIVPRVSSCVAIVLYLCGNGMNNPVLIHFAS